MSTTFPEELNLEKLKAVASVWVKKYSGYIAEISFFCSNKTSFLNLKDTQYCIDFVLCDPPRIEPVSIFSSGFIAKEIPILSVSLLEAMPDLTAAAERERLNSRFNDWNDWGPSRKEMDFLHQWRIDIRWETDQPEPSYLPESKQVLYSRPKNQPTKQIEFSPEDYDRLKQLPYFCFDECIGLMLGMPYEQNIVAIQKGKFDIQVASKVQKKISDFMELLSRSFYDGELKTRENSLDSTLVDPTFKTEIFLEWAKKKGFEIPIGNPVTTDDMKAEVQDHALSVSKNNSDTTVPKNKEIISAALTKGWESERPIDRMSQQRELTIWNKWIQPIVNLHYNGLIEYKYFKEPEKISYDEFEKVWELSIAPFIISCIPSGIRIPSSMSQTEVEDRIMNYMWEPNLFITEILFPLKAGRGADFVDPFLRCLIIILEGKDLPAFLAYIAHGNMEELESESQKTSVENTSNKPQAQAVPDDSRQLATTSFSTFSDKVIKRPAWPGNAITQWEDITISFVSDKQVRVNTPKDNIKLTYSEMGFADGRNKDNIVRAWTMLNLFVKSNGVIDAEKIKEVCNIFSKGSGQLTAFEKFMQVTKELNGYLKKYFNIQDSIFIGSYKKMFKDQESFQKKFPEFFNKKIDPSERKKIIQNKLLQKGYAVKFKIKSDIEIPMAEYEEKKTVFEVDRDDNARLVNMNTSEKVEYSDMRKK